MVPASRQVDVISITAPVQSFSPADSRKGPDNTRGGCISIVKDIGPRYFVLENVREPLFAFCVRDSVSTPPKIKVLYTVLKSLKVKVIL